MRLIGWMLGGVVLSVFWLIGFTGYLMVSETNRNTDYAKALDTARFACMSDNAEQRAEGKTERTAIGPAVRYSAEGRVCPTKEAVAEAFAQKADLALAVLQSGGLLVPVWVFAGIIYAAMRWIRRTTLAPGNQPAPAGGSRRTARLPGQRRTTETWNSGLDR